MDLFTTLVTYNHIRSAAGVSEQELTDTEVDNSGLETDLELEVSEWLPSSTSLTQIYDDGVTLAATEQQKLQMYAMSAYLKYTAAYLLFLTGVIRFSKKISDSANLMERNQWMDEKVLRKLQAQADKYKNKFLDLFDQPADEFDTAIFMGSVPPDYDPVTNT
jgi:hypothetical protein